MLYVLLAVFLLLLIVGPQWWIKSVMRKYNQPRDDIKGTGGEFALHLLTRLGLHDDVQVEPTDAGDHYDPEHKAVRLSPAFFQQRSLAAMVIAAHEVGHAIQDQENHALFSQRGRIVRLAQVFQTVAPIALAISPVLLVLTKSPALSGLTLLIAVGSVVVMTLVHLITLPVEIDASFQKAMPLLEQGHYFTDPADYAAARTLLKAAAMTYVAQSLFSLLNVAYWLRLLRR
ncbi:Uncharacterised protein [BD1-7 clade bacterium]|uniref:Neutral zinc metallopeptidase n=1 Tax=BD1-7 clade bacterium TaxID=2029982 RepID=A0A5S9QA39_9GAMM|nr:Uncharacterised protein [BD1-7 clade bacterium]